MRSLQQFCRAVPVSSIQKQTCLNSAISYRAAKQNHIGTKSFFPIMTSKVTGDRRHFSSEKASSPEDIFSKNYRDIAITDGPIRVYEHGPTASNTTESSRQQQQQPPILLLHGAMLDTAALTWRHVMPNLSLHRRVLAIDMPRHGASRPWKSVTLDQPKLESVLTEVLDSLSLPRVSLVGLSMGAGVSIGYSLAHPERVSALVAINPGGLDATRPSQFLTWLFTRSDLFLRLSMRALSSSPDMFRNTVTQSLSAGPQTRDYQDLLSLAEVEAQEAASNGERVLDDWQIAAYGARRMKVDFSPRLAELKVPSLFMHGAKDTMVTEDVLRRAAELAPNAKFASIPDAGHVASLDQPERVNGQITEFLDEIGV